MALLITYLISVHADELPQCALTFHFLPDLQTFTSLLVLWYNMALEVRCVNTEHNPQDCRDIETIGFDAENGGIATRTPAQVYDLVENEGYRVVVEHLGTRTDVNAVKRGATKYVRSEPNDTKQDNLLKQDSC